MNYYRHTLIFQTDLLEYSFGKINMSYKVFASIFALWSYHNDHNSRNMYENDYSQDISHICLCMCIDNRHIFCSSTFSWVHTFSIKMPKLSSIPCSKQPQHCVQPWHWLGTNGQQLAFLECASSSKSNLGYESITLLKA